MSARSWRITLLRWLILGSAWACMILGSDFAWGQQLTYSTADRATVRVIAVKGLDMAKERVNGVDVHVAVVNAGHGTGVLVSPDGLIITAHHVIQGATHVVVSKLNDPAPYVARVVATNPERDVAVLIIAGTHKDFVPIPANTPTLSARQTVFAIGYPLDVGRNDPQSSRGIVSGVDPSGLLQLNMSINHGNSGGPILDEHDGLVGIAVSTRRNAEGIAYVVPVPAFKELVDSLRPNVRSATHKGADDKAQSDQLLGHLVVSFAQQGHLLGGIWEAMDRDHLASMRALIERILGDHREAPDTVALVAGYFWNEALVLRARDEEEWQARQLRSVALCGTAHRLDAGVDRRSPFVAEVLALKSFGTTAPVAAAPPSSSATPTVARPSALHFAQRQEAYPSVPTPGRSTAGPSTAARLGNELAGFRLGWSREELESACRRAGHQLAATNDGHRCSGPAASLPFSASVELHMCSQMVCRISVRSPLTAQSADWMNRLGTLRNRYEGQYGRAQRNVELPNRCRDNILPCLRDGSARLEYRWELQRRSLSIVAGRHGGSPEVAVSLTDLR